MASFETGKSNGKCLETDDSPRGSIQTAHLLVPLSADTERRYDQQYECTSELDDGGRMAERASFSSAGDGELDRV